MNRRNFLKSIGKICAVLPFVGSSSAVAKTGAPEVRSGTRPSTEFVGDIAEKTFYMDSNNGDDKNTGTNWNQAIRSWKRLDEIMG